LRQTQAQNPLPHSRRQLATPPLELEEDKGCLSLVPAFLAAFLAALREDLLVKAGLFEL
jgi:hypothetical protein